MDEWLTHREFKDGRLNRKIKVKSASRFDPIRKDLTKGIRKDTIEKTNTNKEKTQNENNQ